MLPIVTLTMNPALDVATATDQVAPEHKLRCDTARLDPGGGGVNVARVVTGLGGAALAIYAAGGLTGGIFTEMLARTGVRGRVVSIEGSTRQNFTVDERSTGSQFRFVLDGPDLREEEWQACLTAVEESLAPGSYLVASGSLPLGVPGDFYARVARLAAGIGARCILDTSGPALASAIDAGVFLIKPSLRELRELTGDALADEASQIEAASELVRTGRVELVALTLGAGGALLVWADGTLRLPVPDVKVVSTVGAGDSFLAALTLRMAQGRSLPAAFRAAVAAGTATSMTPGTALCRPEDVERLERELSALPDGNSG